MKRILGVVCGALIAASPLKASFLKGVYDNFKGNSNYTSQQSFNDQKAGYWTGGGLVMRQQPVVINPIQVSLPRIQAGCGGIDAYFGGFSFVQGEQLLELLQKVPEAAISYATQLALQSLSPEIANELRDFLDKIQEITASMTNSCHLGMNLVGGFLPKNTAAEELHCRNLKEANGEDSFGASQHCKKVNNRVQAVEKMKQENEDVLQGEYNITWHIAQKLNFDEETKAFALSALGTVISKKEADGFRVTFHRGFGGEQDFLEGHLLGGKPVDAYICTGADADKKCLDLKKKTEPVKPQDALVEHFRKWFEELRLAYVTNNVTKNAAEQGLSLLIDASSLPLLRYIEISAATGTGGLLNEVLEYMARLILINRIERLSIEVKTAASALEKVQLNGTVLEEFKKHIDHITDTLKLQRSAVNHDALLRFNALLNANETVVKATKGM